MTDRLHKMEHEGVRHEILPEDSGIEESNDQARSDFESSRGAEAVRAGSVKDPNRQGGAVPDEGAATPSTDPSPVEAPLAAAEEEADGGGKGKPASPGKSQAAHDKNTARKDAK